MASYERLKKKIRNDIDTEIQLKYKDNLKTEVICLTGKLLLGLLFVGVSCVAVFSTVKLHMFSDRNYKMDFKRDVQKTENSNFDKVLLKLLLGQKKRNVQTGTTEKTTFFSVLKKLFAGRDTSSFNVNVGMRQDQQLQQCEGSQFKRTFPDIDYAFFGYDLYFGFPLANGHDPGFTYPIFESNYNEGRQTSDCRYKIPDGLVVVPDVSCVTSFSSTIIQNKKEFSKALSVSATANAGVYGVSFSASAGYKKSSSEIATSESVKIISTAKCVYYFSKLSEEYIPRFTKAFLMWVKKLNNTADGTIFIDFLNKYGTHYLTYASFGARFTYENTMKSKTFNTKQEQGVNVAIQASYSGMFSAGAGFNMDSSQKNEASDFQKSVTTKTIAVGATPPANGDSMEWASGVKDNPVPMEYKLKPISYLFTDEYMGILNFNVQHISQHLKIAEFNYCKHLKGLNKLDSCDPIKPVIILTETKIKNDWTCDRIQAASFDECIDLCENEKTCLAASFCTECKQKNNDYNFCCMFDGFEYANTNYSAEETSRVDRWDTVVFDFKIPNGTVFRLDDTVLTGRSRLSFNISQYTSTADQCLQHCINDIHCVAFSFCTSDSQENKCQTYAKHSINGMKVNMQTTTFFIPNFNREAVRLISNDLTMF